MIKKHLLHFMTDVLLPHRSSRFHNNEVSHNKGELLEQSQCFSPTLKNIVISAPVQLSLDYLHFSLLFSPYPSCLPKMNLRNAANQVAKLSRTSTHSLMRQTLSFTPEDLKMFRLADSCID